MYYKSQKFDISISCRISPQYKTFPLFDFVPTLLSIFVVVVVAKNNIRAYFYNILLVIYNICRWYMLLIKNKTQKYESKKSQQTL